MLRKLYAFLLVLALAMPAIVMPASATAMTMDCHAAGMAPAEKLDGAGGKHDAPEGSPASDHGCIGCIASFSHTTRLADGVSLPAMIVPSWVAHALASRDNGPETPPPRPA